MKAHSTEHELWLADLLGGVRLASDPEVAKRLASCTRCRELLAELQPVAERLERAGEARAAQLAELEDAATAPGEEQIAAALERIAAREPHVRRISRGWVVAAAAALIAAAWLARAFLAGSPSEPLWLGPAPLRIVAPRENGSFERFEWSYDGEPAGYALRIHALRDGERGPLLHEVRRWKESPWIPSAELRESLPTSILWSVVALDEFGNPLASADASASRSSR